MEDAAICKEKSDNIIDVICHFSQFSSGTVSQCIPGRLFYTALHHRALDRATAGCGHDGSYHPGDTYTDGHLPPVPSLQSQWTQWHCHSHTPSALALCLYCSKRTAIALEGTRGEKNQRVREKRGDENVLTAFCRCCRRTLLQASLSPLSIPLTLLPPLDRVTPAMQIPPMICHYTFTTSRGQSRVKWCHDITAHWVTLSHMLHGSCKITTT